MGTQSNTDITNNSSSLFDFLKKIDLKTALIAIFFGLSIFFFIKWYFSPDSASLKDKDLQKDIKALQLEKDSINRQITNLKLDYDKKSADLEADEAKIEQINQQLQISSRQLMISNQNLKSKTDSLTELRALIKNAEENPTPRSGEDLLNSLKLKLNNK